MMKRPPASDAIVSRLDKRRRAHAAKSRAVPGARLRLRSRHLWLRKSSSHKLGPASSFSSMQRNDGRATDDIRPINFELNVAPHASGSVLVSMGKTRVICAVMIEETVPRWMKEQGVTGGW